MPTDLEALEEGVRVEDTDSKHWTNGWRRPLTSKHWVRDGGVDWLEGTGRGRLLFTPAEWATSSQVGRAHQLRSTERWERGRPLTSKHWGEEEEEEEERAEGDLE